MKKERTSVCIMSVIAFVHELLISTHSGLMATQHTNIQAMGSISPFTVMMDGIQQKIGNGINGKDGGSPVEDGIEQHLLAFAEALKLICQIYLAF